MPQADRAVEEDRNYYMLEFSNIGGLVMPIILQLGYADGSEEQMYIPAEIWRRDTRLVLNPRSESVEVMHRFNLHDAEHAVQQILGDVDDITASEETREGFADHVRENFALFDGEGIALPLDYVGQEIDGRFLWVYQEMPASAIPDTLAVEHGALREIWPDQINTVNIELRGTLRTLTFTGDAARLDVRVSEP